MKHPSSASFSSAVGDLARISQLEEKSAKLQEDLNVALREKNTHLEEILRFRTESSAAEKELRLRCSWEGGWVCGLEERVAEREREREREV